MTRLSLYLLGSFEISLNGKAVTSAVSSKARALLAYLAVEADRTHPREVLAGLLWPDWPEHSARTNLRNTLSSLRAAIGDRDAEVPVLATTRETIQFSCEGGCWVDVVTFTEQAKGTEIPCWEQAIALYRGAFLEGFSVADSPEFESWVLGVRERLEHQFLAALQALAQAYEQRGDLVRACEYARRRVAHAPWQEQAHQSLMRLLALSGQRGEALAQYEACCRALREELDVEPGEETRRLYERIRDGELGRPTPQVKAPQAIPPVEPSTQAPAVDQPSPPVRPFSPPLRGVEGGLEGERRVVTVMFADIKGSTVLAGQIDTEDWVEMMHHTLEILSAEIRRYGGQVDRYEGDGLVAFFGLAAAHEDDAERSVLAALAMQDEVKHYAAELAEREGAPAELLLRVGLATGEVIATHVGKAYQHSGATAMGRTIALAARLEPAAEPGTVLVGENTYRLVERSFEWQAMGGIAAKGYSEPVPAYRPLKHRAIAGKERGIEGLASPLVGRAEELGALEQAIERLQAGIGGIITVIGEAGIGKSRLVAECRNGAQTALSLQWNEGRCLSYATNTAYQVWLDMVRGLLEVTPDAPPAAVRDALERQVRTSCPDCYGDVYPYLVRLLSLPLDEESEVVLHDLGAQGLKTGTFQAVETLVERATRRHPLVLVCEDLHWADPTSLELLERLFPLTSRAALLLVCVLRPERSHGCWRIVEIAARDYPHCHTDLRLAPLSKTESEALMGNLLHVEDLPLQLQERILDHAEGNPFFVEEILRGLIDEGIIAHDEAVAPSTGLRTSTPERQSEAETAKRSPDTVVSGQCEARGDPPGTRGSGAGRPGRWYATRDVSDIPIPNTLHGALSARIDRLEPETKHVLQLASVIGRIFSYPVLAAIASSPSLTGETGREDKEYWESDDLLSHLVTLERAQLIRERTRLPEREYIFKHHLTQEAAYNGLLKRERQAHHRQVAETLERLYPERIEERVELLAHHWEQAGEAKKAIDYLHQAGDKAMQQSAYQEAIDHLTRAILLLKTLPDRGSNHRLERAQRELALQSSLGMAWHAVKGLAPEALNAYTRARELGRQIGDISRSCRAASELSVLHWAEGKHQRARELSEEALSLAQQTKDPLLAAMSRVPLGMVLFSLGEYAMAQNHFDQMIAFYRPDEHHGSMVSIRGSDWGLSALAYASCCLWCRGYPDRAVERSQEALTLARELGHPFSLADVLYWAGCALTEMRRDWQTLKDCTEELIRIADEKDMQAWLLGGTLSRGAALSMLGEVQEGMALIRKGIAGWQSTGARCRLPGYYRFLVEAQAQAEQPGEGLASLAKALAVMEETGECHWEAELYRVQAELLLMQGDRDGAEASLHRAIEVARRQQARSWELRATTSLARLWRKQGRVDEARQMLAEIYGWFTEGFDTADLVEAKTLLEELSS